MKHWGGCGNVWNQQKITGLFLSIPVLKLMCRGRIG